MRKLEGKVAFITGATCGLAFDRETLRRRVRARLSSSLGVAQRNWMLP
jgi:hypothetical protein